MTQTCFHAFRRALRWCLLAFACVVGMQTAGGLLIPLSHAAGGGGLQFRETVPTVKNSAVGIEINSPLRNAPSSGPLPVLVTISNGSGSAHVWTVSTGEDSYRNAGDQQTSETSVRVEARATATVSVLVPQGARDAAGTTRYRRLFLNVDGYDVAEPRVELPAGGGGYSGATAFVGMGEQLATPIWASLTQQYSDASKSLQGSPVTVGLLGADWRGYTGFDCLWLTDEEYTTLSTEVRAAVRRWLQQGGLLYLSARDLAPAVRTELGLGLASADSSGFAEGRVGFGMVRLIPWDGKQLDLKEAAARIDEVARYGGGAAAFRPASLDITLYDARKWDMFTRLGRIPLHASFLIGFIGLFALLVGPVNLFRFAPADRRHRLFWTTPLISLAASLLLIVVIVLQDGFGGTGERTMLTLLLPAQREAVVIQEQMAHTGVLLSRGFALPEDAEATMVHDGREGVVRTCARAGRNFGGDWFTSRSVQAMRLTAVTPTRAEIQLTRASEGDTPPEIVSSIPATLRELHYTDAAKHHWIAREVRAGVRVALQRDEFSAKRSPVQGSELFNTLPQPFYDRGDGFYAVAEESGAPFLATLPSVRWQRQNAVYVGVVSPVR